MLKIDLVSDWKRVAFLQHRSSLIIILSFRNIRNLDTDVYRLSKNSLAEFPGMLCMRSREARLAGGGMGQSAGKFGKLEGRSMQKSNYMV